MTNHQQKQIEAVNQIESQVGNNDFKFSLVAPVENYDSDPRVSLTSVHVPANSLKQQIQDKIIKPLKDIFPNAYFYPASTLHMTIKNIRVINNPPHFTESDIEKAKEIFSEVLLRHKRFKVYFYRLLLFPNNLALIGTTDPELDSMVLELDQRLKKAELPDDKQYINSQYFFSNITLARFSNPSKCSLKKLRNYQCKLNLSPI